MLYSGHMDKQTLVFIGASGSGKGTQVALLKEYMTAKDPGTPIFYLQMGQHIREFVKGDTYAAKIAREAIEKGELLPSFLAMWTWSELFVKNLTGQEHLILDGTPRTVDEAKNLDIALKFFRREKPAVVYIRVSPEWSAQHLLERAAKEGRADDTAEAIHKRLSWYERDVMPTVARYRRDRDYDFIEINGERTIEEVHKDIVANLFGE